MVKLYVMELGFRTNPNKNLCLDHVWVVTHIRMVFEVLHVTPPTRHPMWVLSGGVTLRDCDWDSLTFSFSELTPAFICTISVITKILSFYIYIILESLLLVLLQFTIIKLYT